MRKNTLIKILFACILVVASIASAQEEPQYGGTLRVALTSEPPTMDFASSTVASTRLVALHIFESLVTYNYNYDVIPQLAENWEANDDHSVYTFYLRQGVNFHNNKEMTAEDVKASIVRFLEISPRKTDFSMVTDVVVTDRYTIQIHLDKPVTNFIPIFALPTPGIPIMPKEAIDGVAGGQLKASQLIGTGPFKFSEWRPTEYILIEKFEDYIPDTRWDGPDGLGGNRTAYVDQIFLRFVQEPGARVSGLLAGDYDFADMVNKDDFHRLDAHRNINTHQIRPFVWLGLKFNTQRPPFDNIKMRQAIQAAFDHDEILYAAVGSEMFYRLNPSIFFEEQIWHCTIGDDMGLYMQNDQEKAKRLLAEAGYDGEVLRFLVTHSYDYYTRSSVVVAEQLRNIGVNVEMVMVDLAGFVERMYNPDDYEMISFAFTLRFDPSGHHSTFSGVSPHTYSSSKIDRYLALALEEPDYDKRYSYYEEVHRILYEDAGFIIHGDIHEFAASRDYVCGYTPFYMAKFWNVWLQ